MNKNNYLNNSGKKVYLKPFTKSHQLIEIISHNFKSEIEMGLIEIFVFYFRQDFIAFSKIAFCFCYPDNSLKSELSVKFDQLIETNEVAVLLKNLIFIHLSGSD